MNAIAMETSPQRHHDARDPHARAEALQREIARHLEQEVADEEDAGAETECRGGKPEVRVHGERRKTDVHAIQVRDEVDEHRNGNSRHVTFVRRALFAEGLSADARPSRDRSFSETGPLDARGRLTLPPPLFVGDQASVIVPRRLPRDAAILHRHLHHAAAVELAHRRSIQLLPRRRACRHGRQRRPASARAISASATSMSQRPAARSMRMRSPVRSHASPPPAALSGEALRIDGLSEVPDCRPSPMRRQARDAALQQRIRRLHVHDLRRSRPAERTRAADHEDRALVDAERGIVDARVIVVRAVEHDRAALEDVRAGEEALAELRPRSRSSS